uniref:Uncharacterized protein n=1 Tax=Strongyloides stercoralis TaxID=6248 RepID=A0AAF5D1H5_STRER
MLWKKLEAVALLELDQKRVNFFFGTNSFRINASYNSETRYYCCCFGGCCSTGTDSEALRLFWKELENVPILQLNLKQRSFLKGVRSCFSTGPFSGVNWRLYDKEISHCYRCFGGCLSTGAESGEWRLFCKKFEDSMKVVVEEVGGCCSTGAESKTCKLFFGRNSFRINASYDSETRYYCCCFGGCCSTGTDSEALRLFWKKVEDVPLLQLNLKHRSFSVMGWKLLLYRSRIRSLYYCCCFGYCCSTGTDSEALRLFWKKLEDVPILQLSQNHRSSFSMKDVVEEVGSCCSTGAESKTCKLFFGRNSFRISASYDSETRYYCCCFGGCYSTGAESGEWRLFCCCSTGTESEALKLLWRKHEDVAILRLSCCSTGAELKTRQLFFFGRNSFSNNAKYDKESRRDLFRINVSYDKESRYVFLFQSTALQFRHYYCCFGGCCLTGTDSEAFRLFWKKLGNALTPQLNLKHRSSSNRIWSMGIHLRGIRNCRSARAGSGAWDNHFWSEQGAVVLLEVDLKDGNSSSMKWRLIETVSEARRFSRNRLGAVVLLRPNLNMVVPLEQTGSCEKEKPFTTRQKVTLPTENLTEKSKI